MNRNIDIDWGSPVDWLWLGSVAPSLQFLPALSDCVTTDKCSCSSPDVRPSDRRPERTHLSNNGHSTRERSRRSENLKIDWTLRKWPSWAPRKGCHRSSGIDFWRSFRTKLVVTGHGSDQRRGDVRDLLQGEVRDGGEGKGPQHRHGPGQASLQTSPGLQALEQSSLTDLR